MSSDETSAARQHPYWVERTLRVRLPADDINKLPILKVGRADLDEKMRSIYFNPSPIYPDGVKMAPGEWGHDLSARYVLEGHR